MPRLADLDLTSARRAHPCDDASQRRLRQSPTRTTQSMHSYRRSTIGDPSWSVVRSPSAVQPHRS